MKRLAKVIGNRINWISTIDSTNIELGRRISNQSNLLDGEVLSAIEQTSGKGMGSNFWESEPGKNLTFSIYLTPHFVLADQQFYLNMAISLGLFDFIRSLTTHNSVKIKWPNDIYIGHKKVAGILINHAISGNSILHTIAGIGVNINQEKFTSDAPNPVSIFQISGIEHDLDKSLFSLLTFIDHRYSHLINHRFKSIRSAYTDALFGYFKWLKFKQNNHKILARITGVSELGLLQLEASDGETFECDLKEIEFII